MDLKGEGWQPKVFRTDEVFDGGELRILRGTDDMSEYQKSFFDNGTHIRDSDGLAIPVHGLYRGVKWLGFQ